MSLLKQSITSDKDYLKIIDDGEVLISASGSPDSDSTFPNDPVAPFGFIGTKTIEHNLGIVPLVRAFWDPNKDGTWYSGFRYGTGGSIDPWLKFIATTTDLKLIMNTDGSAVSDIPVFYRIYDFTNRAATSDSRIDKVFKKDQFSRTIAGTGGGAPVVVMVAIPHPAEEAPLWTVEFSENGDDWYMEGLQIIGPWDTGSGPPGGPYAHFYSTSVMASVDRDNLYVYFINDYTTAKTIYVRYALDYRK